MAIFPLADCSPGDFLFFYNAKSDRDEDSQMREAITASSVVKAYKEIFHVALVIDEKNEKIIHATDNGVIIQSFIESILELRPHCVELCKVILDESWKNGAIEWATNELGSEYNDIFSPECLNSQGKRAFYCSQLIDEAYKASNLGEHGQSPFLPHELNFLDSSGQMLPYWLEYYREELKKLRASSIVEHSAKKYFFKFDDQIERMKKFSIPADLLKSLHFLNGALVNITSGGRFKIIEPRNGGLLAECNSAGQEQLNQISSLAFKAHKKWSKMPWVERRQILNRTAHLLRAHVNELSQWEVRNNGKPISEAKADVLQCAETFEFFGGINLSGEHIPYDEQANRFAYTRMEPFGVVGAIGAWNYPIQTASWKIAPAIACGNAVIYKPSPLAPISSLLLASILQCAGLPDGVVNIVQGGEETGRAICECPLVRKVSFTGSVQTGKRIATACAAQVKPATLELGGKSSLIIFDDADVEMAVNGALMANFLSQGQVCTNASKVLVHRNILGEFTKELICRTENLRIGDPLNEKTHIGACISLEHLNRVQGYIQSALEEGASLLTGGERVTIQSLEDGYFLSPCILNNINPGMKVYREEIFGAVMLIIPFQGDEEALKMANDTEFGLAGGLFTKNLKRAHEMAARMNAGNIYINSFNDVHPNVPFGGFRQSGYGRENGEAALWNYTQIKSVFVNISDKLENPFI